MLSIALVTYLAIAGVQAIATDLHGNIVTHTIGIKK